MGAARRHGRPARGNIRQGRFLTRGGHLKRKPKGPATSDLRPFQRENFAGREVRRFHQSVALNWMAEGFIPSALAMRSTRETSHYVPRSIFHTLDR